ncbi:MAG: hypothetical protein ACM30G_06985 [Micromonosporaceae bacterium]
MKQALDSKETARNNRQVDRACAAATRAIEGLTHRSFVPWTGTRYLDWPNFQYARSYRLWLDSNEVASVSTLVSGGVTIPSTDYFLRRSDDLDEAPYTHIEIDLDSSAAFSSGNTHQRSVAITGVFIGCPVEEEAVGTLSADLAASTSATATITWTTARFGVGDILRIDNERVIITERTMVDSTQNLATPLTAAANIVTVAVTNGGAFAVDETLLLDSERMLVVDIAGNNLTVKRAWDGSVLATHAGSDIYTLTGVEIARAQLGTTLAAHTNGATIYRYVVPPLVRDLAIAEAMNELLQESAGYARTAGSGDNERELSAKGLKALREDVYARYGRKARKRAV